ncbi:interferon-inducible double-stranded RNA-dependent protein kinase activator A homolog isoform X2 [Scaptodrosophila lebanonensis]|uniref:Interferon-inducible double-stranded RNA-dependent protein kinase activator A homolog isoform X2 n=1 Tax=Drosophila lebanonensis TaxID=7225 RepID=A0A6J2TLD2_DROLE|nr:interferon-inducible double-stranded RNA-dependent protein kinase activator A homolog isoform X2 [Scaptodrosophila lebanonensis]
MDQENYHGLQQSHLQHQQLQQHQPQQLHHNQHQMPQPQHHQPVPMQLQAGFAPRRQYENLTCTAAAMAAVNMANGGSSASESGKTGMLQRAGKGKREKILPMQMPHQMADINTASSSHVPVEESLKLVGEADTSGLATKTPVSILQELLSRRGITPGYELVQIEGAIHEPTFRFRVSFKDKDTPFTAMGAGRSKKEAKHAAARALIDKLIGVQLPEMQGTATAASVAGSSSAGSGGDGSANMQSSGDDKIVGNPIGWLQEMCMQRRWPPPSYETETEVGLPHERLFTIACTIVNNREVGKGKSKKIAKRLAAHKMWTRLQETPIDAAKINDSICTELEGDARINDIYYGDLKDITVPTLTTQHSNKVSQFHKALKNATGKKLLKLQTCLRSPKIDFIKLLSEIAVENQFEVTYVDIEEKTYTGQYQCLVQLSTLPVGVCHGTGATTADAQRHAAQSALEYLKIMTKK